MGDLAKDIKEKFNLLPEDLKYEVLGYMLKDFEKQVQFDEKGDIIITKNMSLREYLEDEKLLNQFRLILGKHRDVFERITIDDLYLYYDLMSSYNNNFDRMKYSYYQINKNYDMIVYFKKLILEEAKKDETKIPTELTIPTDDGKTLNITLDSLLEFTYFDKHGLDDVEMIDFMMTKVDNEGMLGEIHFDATVLTKVALSDNYDLFEHYKYLLEKEYTPKQLFAYIFDHNKNFADYILDNFPLMEIPEKSFANMNVEDIEKYINESRRRNHKLDFPYIEYLMKLYGNDEGLQYLKENGYI